MQLKKTYVTETIISNSGIEKMATELEQYKQENSVSDLEVLTCLLVISNSAGLINIAETF